MNPKHHFDFSSFVRRYGALCALLIVGAALSVSYILTEDPSPAVPLATNAPSGTQQPAATHRSEVLSPTPLPRPESTFDDEELSAETGLFSDSIPMVCPAEGEVQRPFSMDKLIYQPTLAEYSTHSGIDIICLNAQTVVSAADGEVEKIYTDALMGNCILIDHGKDTRTLYACLETCLVEEGQKLQVGDPIATAGNSGKCESAQGTHLHFEVLLDGEPQDPEDYLRS